MTAPSGLGKAIRVIRGLGMASGVAGAGAAAAGLAGVTLAGPWSAVAAAGLLALAGLHAWKQGSDAAQANAQLEQTRKWLESFARDKACQDRGLAAAIAERRSSDPGVLKGLPSEITDSHLATFLAILESDGQEQAELLKAHDAFIRATSEAILRHVADVSRDIERVGFETALTLAEVRESRQEVQDSRADTAELLAYARLDRQPPIAIERGTGRDESSRFVFRARRLSCVGREVEMAELGAWLDDPGPFSWDLWTGHAGMGKSRLALELCLERRSTWDVGFYQWPRDKDHHWGHWTPARDTLIVFDDVAQHAERIREFLDAFADYRGQHRLRLLLLERPIPRFERPQARTDGRSGSISRNISDAGWWTTIDPGPESKLRDAHARKYTGNRPDRELAGISEAALDAMVTEEWKDATGSTAGLDLEKVRPLIEKITPDRRPLFIAMAAEAIREKKIVPDAETLIEHIIKRENKEHWEPALATIASGRGDEAGYRRLLCLATLCGGLGGEALGGVLSDPVMNEGGNHRLVPTVGQYQDGAIYGRLVPDADANTAPKLEPDILGECFVLQSLKEQGVAYRRLVGVGWKHADHGVFDFALRAAMNFPLHPGLDVFLNALPDDVPDSFRAEITGARLSAAFEAEDWAKVGRIGQEALKRPNLGEEEEAAGLFAVLSGKPDDQARADATDRVRRLAPRVTGERSLRLLASGLVNAIGDCGEDFTRADDLLSDLRDLAQAHPDDAAVRERLAKGLNNAIFHSGADFTRADDLLSELRDLAWAHPADAAVRGELAKGLVNAIGHSGEDFTRADDLLSELRGLAEQPAADAAVREAQATGLDNAIFHSGKDFKRADAWLSALRDLAKQHPVDAAVREALARGLFNAFNHSPANSERANDFLKELRGLAQAHPDDAAVREALAKGLFNAIVDSGEDFTRADRLLSELRGLAEQHPVDAAVREALARGLFNAFHDSPANSKRANDFLKELRGLAQAHPDDAAVRERLATGLFNAIFHSGKDFTRADDLLSELRGLAQAHPADAAVRGELAKGLFNAFNHCPANSERANDFLKELRGLAQAHPADAAVPGELAKGLVNAIFHSGEDFTRADDLLSDLRGLAEQHPADAAVRGALAKGLNNAIRHSGADFTRADDLLSELRGLAQAHPADAAVREALAKGLNNAIAHSGEDFDRADGLLSDLRDLAEQPRDDAAVRERLAKGLFNAIFHSGEDFTRADDLLSELRGLAQAHPDDAAVQSVAFLGHGGAFIKAAEAGSIRPDLLDHAADILARCTPSDKLRGLVLKLIHFEISEVEKPAGEAKAALDAALERLNEAYFTLFPDARPTPGPDEPDQG